MTSKENPDSSELAKNWERDLRRGLLKLMILLLIRLKTEEAHAYGLISLLRETNIPLKAGTVYPLLKRMEAEGLISSLLAEDLESPGNPRRFYTITSSGENAIESMIQTYFMYHQSIQTWYSEIQSFNIKRGWSLENETDK
ncbi:MAG: PadR family transcriptional regulator [Candidatus Hodarchaeales archaeon]|jgi:DNA-binding PadR family transcriptional regulator